ncbi:Predicted PurR-regulated permease PerM [Clostridium amylolyticum]|uniref:Predicted PurR-regulated permease PerM n=1 Tax=Clostridium amylolyticum TaxID=1121298 RepID=A0A1M6DAC6_9CLOT|nr:AI-2E family transporter [Clostridium amylolyticum]SHI70196.1 Predicted PurR-regulated permease PerM [Clostridium amylolyticum]
MKNAYKLLYCILLLLIFVAINYFIQSYFKPTFIIIVLYVITLPLFNLIIKKVNNFKIASILSLIIINAMIIIISFYMGNYLFELIVDKVITQKTYFDIIIKNILSKFNMSFEDLWNNLSKISNPLFIKSAAYTGEIVIVYFIGNVTVYFLLSDKNIVIELIKIFFPERYLLNIKKSMLNIKHLLTMEIIMVLASTLEILIGFLVLGIKDAFILSFICGLLDILPYVGTVIVFIPLIIYNIVIKQYFTAFGLIFLYILIGIVRQILEAKYIGNKFSIHPLLIILSLYIGIEMFGIFGLFIGPLYVIMAKEIILN